jgi:ATPase family associated with various cellular activities (AAA)
MAIGAVTDLARELLPAVIVLEDVDLVAEERSHGPASSPVLFDLLDAMDGAGPDADLLFLLTTNRADLLEPALAARPRTDGTTASFVKELIRRSVLEALHDDPALTAVTGVHVARALDDLLDSSQAVTRTLLGVGVDPATLPAGGLLRQGPIPHAARLEMMRRMRYDR